MILPAPRTAMEPAHQHHNIGDDEGGEDAVYGNGMFHEQERAGGEPLNHERAEHDGGNDVSGHPRVRRGISAPPHTALLEDSVAAMPSTQPLPYISGVLEKAFGLRIGEEGCRTDARSRDDADKRADDGGTDEVHDVAVKSLSEMPRFDTVLSLRDTPRTTSSTVTST